MFISELGILLALALIMFIAYRRVNMVVASLFASIVVCLSSQLGIIDTLIGSWSVGFADFIKSYYLIFAICALFGKVIEDTGCASILANWIYRLMGPKASIYGCIFAATVIVYGGVNAFVAVFTIYPIFVSVFRKVNLPRRLLPGVIYAPLATYASAMIPGALSIPQLITQQQLGTSLTSGATIGIVCAIVTVGLQVLYFEWEFKRARARGEGFEIFDDEKAQVDAFEKMDAKAPYLSLLPFIVTLALINVFKLNVLISVFCGILIALILYWKNAGNKLSTLNFGITSAAGAIINTSAVVAFGAVIKSTLGFQGFIGLIDKIPGSPIVSFGLAVQLLAGISGSASGGLAIALQTLGKHYLALGVNPELLHRIAVIASVGLDTLPHCGLVVTVLTHCKMTHKEAYKPIFVVSVLITLIAFIVALIMGSFMYPM